MKDSLLFLIQEQNKWVLCWLSPFHEKDIFLRIYD